MTYAQPYGPQGYQPQPNPYGGQFAQAPYAQQPAPAMGGQALPTQAPALGVGTRTGEGGPKSPQPRHLIGRTVIFEPIRIDETTKNLDDEVRPTAYYHLTVVDGGPLEYGDNKSQKIADQHGYTMRTDVPARFVNVSSDRWGIVQEIRDAMARGDLATVGVIEQGTRGTKGSPPFLVTRPGTDINGKDRPDGDRRFVLASQVWNDVFAKTFRSPEPVSLVAPPQQAPQQVSYQQAPQPQGPTYGTAGGPPQYAYPTQQQYATYEPAGAMVQTPTYGTAGGPASQPNPYGGQFTQAEYAPPVPPSAQQGYGQDPAYEAWLASLPPEQRAAMQAQPPAPPQGGPGL